MEASYLQSVTVHNHMPRLATPLLHSSRSKPGVLTTFSLRIISQRCKMEASFQDVKAFHQAAKEGNAAVVEELLTKGMLADVKATDVSSPCCVVNN